MTNIDLAYLLEEFKNNYSTDSHHLFQCAKSIIATSSFSKASTNRKAQALIIISWKLALLRDSAYRPIAILIIQEFNSILKDSYLDFQNGMELYNALYSLLWTSADDITALQPFLGLSRKFQNWLQLKLNIQKIKKKPISSSHLKIAYLLHSANDNPTNAVPPLIVSLAKKHAQLNNRKIFLYLVHTGTQEFIEKISNSNVIVRPFLQEKYEKLNQITNSMNDDQIDVVITDQNRSVGTALFTMRVAPIQIFADVGFPYWDIENIDWTLSPNLIGEQQEARSVLSFRQTLESLKIRSDSDEVFKIRALFPKNAFILGVFTRLIKITENFLHLVDRILNEDSRFFLIIIGGGSPQLIQEFISKSPNKEKITFINDNVDLSIYGKVIDVMCDTFPFVGGVACRQVNAQGTPVVAKLGTPWDPLLQAERSPKLLAHSEDDYLQIIKRLLNDADFLQDQRRMTLDLVDLHTDVSMTVQQVENAIQAAIRKNNNEQALQAMNRA